MPKCRSHSVYWGRTLMQNLVLTLRMMTPHMILVGGKRVVTHIMRLSGQSRADSPSSSPKWLDIVCTGGWLGCSWCLTWEVVRGRSFPCRGQHFCAMNFTFTPKGGRTGLSYQFDWMCGRRKTRRNRFWVIKQSNIEMESDPSLQVLMKEMESYWLRNSID